MIDVATPIRGIVSADERRQVEHELHEALVAARSLQARLEMLGGRPDDVRWVRDLRNRLVDDVLGNALRPAEPEAGR